MTTHERCNRCRRSLPIDEMSNAPYLCTACADALDAADTAVRAAIAGQPNRTWTVAEFAREWSGAAEDVRTALAGLCGRGPLAEAPLVMWDDRTDRFRRATEPERQAWAARLADMGL